MPVGALLPAASVQPDAGKAARREVLSKELAEPEPQWDYVRWYGSGRDMTDAEWQKFTEHPAQHYKPEPGMSDEGATEYDRTIQLYHASTPAQRLQQPAYFLYRGTPTKTTVEGAYKHAHALLDKQWEKHFPKPDEIPSP